MALRPAALSCGVWVLQIARIAQKERAVIVWGKSFSVKTRTRFTPSSATRSGTSRPSGSTSRAEPADFFKAASKMPLASSKHEPFAQISRTATVIARLSESTARLYFHGSEIRYRFRCTVVLTYAKCAGSRPGTSSPRAIDWAPGTTLAFANGSIPPGGSGGRFSL